MYSCYSAVWYWSGYLLAYNETAVAVWSAVSRDLSSHSNPTWLAEGSTWYRNRFYDSQWHLRGVFGVVQVGRAIFKIESRCEAMQPIL